MLFLLLRNSKIYIFESLYIRNTLQLHSGKKAILMRNWITDKIYTWTHKKALLKKHQEEDLLEVKNRLYNQDVRDSYVLHLKDSKPLEEASSKVQVMFTAMDVEERLDEDLQTIDVIFRDLKKQLTPLDIPSVSPDVYARNKSILRFFKEHISEQSYQHNVLLAEKLDFNENCPCGSGKEYYTCHLK